jgi:SOS response regulatory protein OraA/RecX
MPVVTALKRAGRRRVAVEVDGAPWRVLPLEPVVAAGLAAGVELDRERARRLRRELRRAEARKAALDALRHQDHTEVTLRARLDRRGLDPGERDAAVETMKRAGLVDDARLAHGRAAALAARGSGDLRIRDDLMRRGVARGQIDEALASIEPELERIQAIVTHEGVSSRVLRRLVAKGFTPEALEAVVADQADSELG